MFIDTGAFVARHREDDAWHEHAFAAWEQVIHSSRACFTSNLVVAEAVTLIARYAGYDRAAEIGRELFASQIQILRDTTEDDRAALDLMEKFSDQKVGFADCVSFVLMQNRKIKTVFGFDRHFEMAGFKLWPDTGKY